MAELRILIVDEQPIVEQGLAHFLRQFPELSIVATARDGLEGLEKLRQTPADILILDLCLPKLDGIETIRLVLEEQPELAVIVYTGQKHEASVYQALKAGARGYILKSSPILELVAAIREIQGGGYALSPCLNPAIVEFYLQHRELAADPFGEYQGLSGREKQVFRLLAEGKQTREIGDILCISPKTVAKHRVAVKRKLAMTNMAELAQYAMRIGVIEVEGPTGLKQ